MTLSEELGKLECPINWDLPETSLAVNDTRRRVLYKVDHEVGQEDDESIWQKICQCLVMFLLDYKDPNNDVKAMGNYLKKIEDALVEAKGYTPMRKQIPAIEYVMKALQAHYYYKLGDEDQAKSYIEDLKPFAELSKYDQAVCYALRACCFMEFASAGFDEALEWINKALDLDSEDPEWNFLKGKCLARTRRFGAKVVQPSIEELQCLGKSAKAEHCSPYHLVFCAQSLLEYAQNCDFIQRDADTARSYYTKCAELFRRAATKGDNNGVVLIRTAKGLMHMYGYGIEDLLENCVFRSLELLPTSGFVNAVVGEWYYIRAKDIDTAIRYLRTASREHKIMSSYRYLLTILFLHRSHAELDAEVEGFWKNFRDSPLDRVKTLKVMAAYFFFERNDILTAAYYMKEWLECVMKEKKEENDKSPMFIFCNDLTAALVGEINTCLNDPRCEFSSDEEDELRAFLEVVREARPHLNIHKLRTPREDTIRESVYKCHRDPEKKKILMEKYKLKPSGYTSYNKNSWRK